jgi:hypothetical protein
MIGMVTLVSKVNELVSGSVLIMLNLLVLYSKKYLLFYQSFYIHEIKKYEMNIKSEVINGFKD